MGKATFWDKAIAKAEGEQLSQKNKRERDRAASAKARQEAEMAAGMSVSPGGPYAVPGSLADVPTKIRVDTRLARQIEADEAAAEADIPQRLTRGSYSGSLLGAAAGVRGEGDRLYDELTATVTSPSRPNPKRPIREAATDKMLGTRTGEVDQYGNAIRSGGVLERQQQAEEDIGAAKVDIAAVTAAEYGAEAGRQQAQLDADDARLARDQLRRERMLEGQQAAYAQIQKMTDAMLATPEVDAGRYWASRKGYQKVAWALSAIADGIRGLDPMAQLNRAIEMDINEQKANIGLSKEKVGIAGSMLGSGSALFSELRASLGDDNLAADAMRIARIDEFKTRLIAMQQRAGVPLEVASASKEVAALEERRAQVVQAFNEKLASTPLRIGGGTRPVLTGPIRATKEKELARLRGRSDATEMKGYDVQAKALADEARIAGTAKVGKETAAQRLDLEAGTFVARETKLANGVKNMIEELKTDYAPSGVPGMVYGIGSVDVPFSDDDEIAQFRLGLAIDGLTQLMTGASSPPEMQARYIDGIRNAKSEGELWGALDAAYAFSLNQIENTKRAVSPEDNARFERVSPDVYQDYDPEPSRTSQRPVIEWED
jgi:hypothetical protein